MNADHFTREPIRRNTYIFRHATVTKQSRQITCCTSASLFHGSESEERKGEAFPFVAFLDLLLGDCLRLWVLVDRSIWQHDGTTFSIRPCVVHFCHCELGSQCESMRLSTEAQSERTRRMDPFSQMKRWFGYEFASSEPSFRNRGIIQGRFNTTDRTETP